MQIDISILIAFILIYCVFLLSLLMVAVGKWWHNQKLGTCFFTYGLVSLKTFSCYKLNHLLKDAPV